MSTPDTSVDQGTYESVVRHWPEEPSEIAENVVETYGFPQEVTETRLIWHDCPPWKRTELFRDGVPHHFPKKHTDYLEQVIDYHVPPERVEELTRYDGSVMFERTTGELSARCDREAMNFLAINLAHDVITGRKSVEEAREVYAKTAVKTMMGATPDATEQFQFPPPETDQRDPDESIVTETMRNEIQDRLGSDEN